MFIIINIIYIFYIIIIQYCNVKKIIPIFLSILNNKLYTYINHKNIYSYNKSIKIFHIII